MRVYVCVCMCKHLELVSLFNRTLQYLRGGPAVCVCVRVCWGGGGARGGIGWKGDGGEVNITTLQ